MANVSAFRFPDERWTQAIKLARMGNPLRLAKLVESEPVPDDVRAIFGAWLCSLKRPKASRRKVHELCVDKIRQLFDALTGTRYERGDPIRSDQQAVAAMREDSELRDWKPLTVEAALEALSGWMVYTVDDRKVKLSSELVRDIVYRRNTYCDAPRKKKRGAARRAAKKN